MIKLEESKIYPFIIKREVQLPDGIVCYSLEDPNGIKHLLPKNVYNGYGLEAGMEIYCRIDKINCSGRIFIEPLHPVYREGACHDFHLSEIKNETLSAGKIQMQAILKDQFGNTTTLPAEDLPEAATLGDTVTCRIDMIKKGGIYVRPCEYEDQLKRFPVGEIISVKISGLKMYSGNREYYLLTDHMGRKFTIRKKYYHKYGFSNGDQITCEVRSETGQKFLEPRHPVFRKGKVHVFEVLGEDVITTYADIKIPVLNLKNPYGKTIVVEKQNVDPNQSEKNRITFRVLDILRGRPVLEHIKEPSPKGKA